MDRTVKSAGNHRYHLQKKMHYFLAANNFFAEKNLQYTVINGLVLLKK